MCVEFSFRDLTPNPCPPIPTKTYTYEVTITPMLRSDIIFKNNRLFPIFNLNNHNIMFII